MENGYLSQLDEFFAEQYSDYVRISAIEGYKMPEMIVVDADGNISRRDPKYMRLCYQADPAALLRRFKETIADTSFTFDFSFPTFRERLGDLFRKDTFAKRFPEVLARYDETVDSLGKKLTTEEKYYRLILKGKLYPEKNFLMAVALVTRMHTADVNLLLSLCGFTLKQDDVRDVVFEYLLMQKIFNETMRDNCLREYSIDTLPIKRDAGAPSGID